MSILVNSSGTQTATISTEHTLATITSGGEFQLNVDCSALVNGDTVILRQYIKTLSGGASVIAAEVVLSNIPVEPSVFMPRIPASQEVKYTLQQTAGTGRAFPWAALQVDSLQSGDNYARLGAPAGASVSADVAAAKVDTAAIKVQTDKLAFTVANQVDSNVIDWKGAAAPAMTGDAFARLGAPAGASHAADVAAVKSDTGTILTDVNTGAGAIYTRLGAPAGASHAADIAAVKTDTAAVKVQTDKLAFTVANQVDVNVLDWKSAVAPAMTGDSFARLGAPVGASHSADVAGVPAAILASVIEGTTTVLQAFRGYNSVLLAKTNKSGSVRNFRDLADTKNRVAATLDSSNNRTALTYDFT